MMREFAGPALVLLAAAFVSPAAAQIVPRHPSGDAFRPNPLTIDRRASSPGISRDMRDVRERISDARNAGTISRAQARQLRRETWAIDNMATLFGRDGLSASEQRELETRALYLRGEVDRPRSK
jgi:hypothetical protein